MTGNVCWKRNSGKLELEFMRSVYDVNDTTNMQRVFALFYLGKSWHKLIQSRAEGGKEGASAARSGKPQKL